MGGGIKVHSTLRPLNGLLCQPLVIMIMEKSVGWLAGETEVLGENLPQCRFVHHKPHMLPGGEHRPPRIYTYNHKFIFQNPFQQPFKLAQFAQPKILIQCFIVSHFLILPKAWEFIAAKMVDEVFVIYSRRVWYSLYEWNKFLRNISCTLRARL
jgi:hypothetical protein